MSNEIMCKSLYSKVIKKDFGILFYNEKNKMSHDSNHAILFEDKISDLRTHLEEIKNFYIKKDLNPRIYQTKDGYFKANQCIFEEAGFELIRYGDGLNKYSTLSEKCQINQKSTLKIRVLQKYDDRILSDIFGPDDCAFDALTIKEAFMNRHFYLVIGEKNGRFVTCASIYYYHGIGRIDHVETTKSERGKGYCLELFQFIVEWHRNNFSKYTLFEWPANEIAEKIYYNAGFRYLFSKENTVAVYTANYKK